MQELIEFIDDKFIVSNSPQISSIYNKAKELLEKEKQYVKPLVDALEDIKNWDDDLEVEWGDCGYRAITALNEFNNQNQ